MKHYKKLLLKELAKEGWEVTEIKPEADWWLEEFWTLQSTRQCWGAELKIIFLVDPIYEGGDKGTAVWAIMAAKHLPATPPVGDSGIALLPLQHGLFNEQLALFTNRLNEYRLLLSQQ